MRNRIIKAKKPASIAPGDLPRKLVKTCADEIANPARIIFNTITRTATYPSSWKTEHQVALPKVYPPQDEDELRNIAKTPFLSKVYELFVAEWLLHHIKPYLDPNQCGLKGSSINHYLIKLLHFVHKTLDMRKPQAVLAACVDLSKAYNRVDHSLVICDLYDMKTPSWLLRIISSYLTQRSMTLTYRGAQSSERVLPGGSPQGAFLGGLIFMIKFNGAFLRPPIPRNTLIKKAPSIAVKFVDDGTVAAGISLETCLVPDSSSRPKPLTFRERCGFVLPPENNPVQCLLEDTERFTKDNNMIINKKKTEAMLFSFSRKFDFPPELKFEDGSIMQTVTVKTILGVQISDDLKWKHNTNFIVSKARGKIWILRRLQPLNFSFSELFDVYIKEIRSILEYAVPVWHSGLTHKQSSEIEAVQKLAFRLILRQKYSDYNSACAFFATDTLERRRQDLCLRFARKNMSSSNSFFTIPNTNVNLRERKQNNEFRCNTKRFQRSSLPFLASLINEKS